MKKICLIFMIIFTLVGCNLEKKVYSEEDKLKIADQIKEYDAKSDYKSNWVILNYSKNGVDYYFEYRLDVHSDESITILYQESTKESNIQSYEFNKGMVSKKVLDNSYNQISIENEEMTKVEFLKKYSCENCTKYNLDLINTEYYRIEVSGFLNQESFWKNYFTFEHDYVYKLSLYDNSWEFKDVKVMIDTKSNDEDYGFNSILINCVDKNEIKYSISIKIEK